MVNPEVFLRTNLDAFSVAAVTNRKWMRLRRDEVARYVVLVAHRPATSRPKNSLSGDYESVDKIKWAWMQSENQGMGL